MIEGINTPRLFKVPQLEKTGIHEVSRGKLKLKTISKEYVNNIPERRTADIRNPPLDSIA